MRHDKIFLNRVEFYFLTQRRPATHWHQFDPGLQTSMPIQAEIIRELRQARTRWIYRDPSFDGVMEPNGSTQSSGVVLLDRYIAAHYRPIAIFGRQSVWLAKEVAKPAAAGFRCSSLGTSGVRIAARR